MIEQVQLAGKRLSTLCDHVGCYSSVLPRNQPPQSTTQTIGHGTRSRSASHSCNAGQRNVCLRACKACRTGRTIWFDVRSSRGMAARLFGAAVRGGKVGGAIVGHACYRRSAAKEHSWQLAIVACGRTNASRRWVQHDTISNLSCRQQSLARNHIANWPGFLLEVMSGRSTHYSKEHVRSGIAQSLLLFLRRWQLMGLPGARSGARGLYPSRSR